ncbi:hypothetical protein [Klebsiella grimontii]|uniref:hypothetical protein n=1 Tax=Klebsiella grimontii TaxID=2058152 RepID=UPI0007CC7FCC|nr:hypothetical protein [Klebsiella grimontii]MBS6568773.1 hypothetical protein [Klebsiella michiganensis]MBZ7135069.1 hypothetical protein [Klebsiella grimontii]MDU4226898.1 hypothetical protein [Klebsiella grimontii]MDU4310447.1 hypothetical protein [Klebsiella michiganensis]SAP52893.1 Uncharacterised protein [Klebsiella grimontii]
MTNDDSNGVITEQNDPEKKTDLLEDLPDLPEPLPDLTRLYKRRCRDESVIKKAKSLLVHGMTVNKVALLLRLPLDKVQQLHSEGWNNRCRRVTPHNAWTCQKLAIQCFRSGAMLTEICSLTDMPIFTIISMLEREGIASADLLPRMPSEADPLMVEYRRTVSRHKSLPCRRKPIQINPVRRTSKHAGQTATA